MKCPSCASYLDASATKCWRCKQSLGPSGGGAALAGATAGGSGAVAAPPAPSWEVGAPPERKSRSGIVVGVVALLAIGLVFGGAMAWRLDLLDLKGHRAVDDYVGGGGVEYVSEGGRYTVDLPTSPSETNLATPMGVDLHFAISEPGSDYVFGVVFSDPLPTTPTGESVNRQLEAGAAFAAQDQGGKVVGLNDDPFVSQGRTYPAIDVRIEIEGAQAKLRSILIDDRIYLVMVVSEEQEPEAFRRLVDSFRPEL